MASVAARAMVETGAQPAAAADLGNLAGGAASNVREGAAAQPAEVQACMPCHAAPSLPRNVLCLLAWPCHPPPAALHLPPSTCPMLAAMQLEAELTSLWVLVCAFFVFQMQSGFALLEAGSVRAKNTKNICEHFVFSFFVFLLLPLVPSTGWMPTGGWLMPQQHCPTAGHAPAPSSTIIHPTHRH